ncbi:MAG: AAA family ATPase [Polyangiales bacterium]
MKLTRFWARGYRSLRDVTLDPLGDFNVFYGPNGSGKSNVVRGVETLVRAAEVWTEHERPGTSRFAASLARRDVLHADDRHRGARPEVTSTVLGLEAIAQDDPRELDLALGRIVHSTLLLELTVDWNGSRPFGASLRVEFDGEPWEDAERAAKAIEPGASARLTLARLVRRLFWTVSADRALRDESLSLEPPVSAGNHGESDDDPSASAPPSPIYEALRAGHLQTAIFHAKNDWDRENRARFDHLRALVARTLDLPEIDVGRDPVSGLIELRQPLRADPTREDISLRSAGLGVEQLVAIVASIMFSRSAIVAVEEPEAHLHAPTTGRSLRALLKGLVEPSDGAPRLLHQLFIATHSNLFDLDPHGYWDVSLKDGATAIRRGALHELYAHHLYEPGPAKRLLASALEQFGEEVVFRSKDGRRIGTAEMLRRLDEDDEIAMEFVRDMHAAALATLRVRAQREGDPR